MIKCGKGGDNIKSGKVEDDEDMASEKVVLDLPSEKELPLFRKIISNKEKKKCSSCAWLSNLAKSFNIRMDVASVICCQETE